MKLVNAAILATSLGTGALAQQPLSAIDWLDDVMAVPLTNSTEGLNGEPPVSATAGIPDVTVLPLDATTPDATGLLPSSTTGLPQNLWSSSNTNDLTAEISRLSAVPLPAIQALYYTLLLAEADAPLDTDQEARLLTARIRALTNFGAVEPARALLERAGPTDPKLFDQWLDLALLSGAEDKPCRMLRDQPSLSDRYAARIFCIARAGDWPTAALTYETAVALENLTSTEATLLAQFLDPESVEDTPDLVPSNQMTPLLFKLFEAVGNPLPTRRLPRAYAMADLRNTSGWKAEIEAAERLAQTSALPANRLLGLYTSRKPAASGGVWDRVDAIQSLDHALNSKDAAEISAALPQAWNVMRRRGLEVPFAQLFAAPLRNAKLKADDRILAFKINLLSSDYEAAKDLLDTPDKRQSFLIGLAAGAPVAELAQSPAERAIASAFAGEGPDPAHEPLLQAGKLGQTILLAATDLDQGNTGNLQTIISSLRTLRAVGLEDTARRAALQLLILKDL